MLGADAHGSAPAQAIKLGCLRFHRGRIAFIGDQITGLFTARSFSDTCSSSPVTPARISTTKRMTAACSNGDIDLPFDFVGQVVGVFVADAAGVEEFEEALLQLDGRGNAIAA